LQETDDLEQVLSFLIFAEVAKPVWCRESRSH